MQRRLLASIGFVLVCALAVLSFSHGVEGPRRAAYTIARAYEQKQAERLLPESALTDGAITLYFDEADAALAPLMLAELTELREPVAALLGLSAPERVTAVLHPTRADLAAVFGWNDGERAHGVYAAGIVRLLSPQAWLRGITPADGDAYAEALRAYGPVAHELAHLTLDLHTAGNYPAWLSEGLAQWVEFQLGSGRRPPADEGWHTLTRPYTLRQLDREFDSLPDQTQAYRQSYYAVAYLEERGGADGIRQLVAALAHGQSLDTALQQTFGLTVTGLQESLLSGEKPTRGGTGREHS